MREEIRELIPQLPVLIRYYKKTYYLGGGGSLHMIIDDGNVDDDDIYFCREECFTLHDVLGMLICDVMSEMNRI